MKTILNLLLALVGAIAVVAAMLFVVRTLSAATLSRPVVHQVTPRVQCASLTSGDGVALSCWREPPPPPAAPASTFSRPPAGGFFSPVAA